MSHETKIAIEKIISICEQSRQPTKRIERVYDIALESVGLTFNQRNELIVALRRRAIQIQRDKLAKHKENKNG